MKKYNVIYADPAWDVKKIKRKVRPNQVEFDYPTMKLEDIKGLKVKDICEDNSLDTDPDDYDEDEVEKLRKAVAKELGINLPKKQEKKSKSKKGKK